MTQPRASLDLTPVVCRSILRTYVNIGICVFVKETEAGMNQTVNRFRAEFFKALGHPVRIVILETLSSGEKSVSEMQEVLGIEQSSVSRQLAYLRIRGIVDDRKEGAAVFYRLRDATVLQLLDAARTIFSNHLIDTQNMLQQLASDEGGQ